jgi:hypothetical protein
LAARRLDSPTARQFCATCGFPLTGASCDACGGNATPLVLSDAVDPWDPSGGAPGTLDRAVEAFRGRDYPRMVAHLLGAEGWPSRTVTSPRGSGWIVTIGDALVFLGLDPANGRVTVEAPVVRLPEHHRVPALRLALELSANPELPCRFSLRRELLVLSFGAPLGQTPPSFLHSVMVDVATLSRSTAQRFRARFDAPLAIVDARSGAVEWAALGEARALPLLAPHRRLQAPVESEPEARDDSIPAILAPKLASSAAARNATSRQPQAEALPAQEQARRTLHEFQLDAVLRGLPDATLPSAEAVEASRLCELLGRAQALASAPGADSQPAMLALLIRATVFRSIHGFGASLPDAVAHLYRATAAATRQTWTADARQNIAPGAGGRPTLEVLDRLIAAKAQVPKERPLAVDPLTTAAQAREHLKHYVNAIECAPDELPIRHFLALGALAELIARTKLPSPTEQRLRDIVAHAERDEPRTASLELMMTTLGRIISP